MKTNRSLFSLCLLLVPTLLPAQELEPIQIDRPDQTECPFIVPRHYIQVESGFLLEQTDAHHRAFDLPSTLWKYGLNERMEFRLITEVLGTMTRDMRTAGLVPLTLGFKSALTEEKGIWPKTSFIGHLTAAKWGSESLQASYFAPSFRFTMQHTLSDAISLGYNIGAEWDGETGVPDVIYTLTGGFSITEKFGGYIEAYGFLPTGSRPDHRLDGGFTFLASDDVILDLSGGIGLTENAPDYYAALGFSFRFCTQR